MKYFFLLCLLAATAEADLNIIWKNTQHPIYLGYGGGPYVSDRSLALLVWSEAGMIDQAGSYDLSNGGILQGEYLLDSTTTAGGFGLWGDYFGNMGGDSFQ